MIYFFTGNSDYLLKNQVFAWKNQFIAKYGDFNCVDIKNIKETDNNILWEHISSGSFLAEKKLVIISLEWKIDETDENFLLKCFDKIPDNNIILLHKINPDKRKKFIKSIMSLSTHKEFLSGDEGSVYQFIQSKYNSQISAAAIREIVRYKSANIWKIIPEIEKLLIWKPTIEISDIQEHIFPELEASIFECIDAILQKDIPQITKLIPIILEQSSIYWLYASLLANLRNTLYISYLKSQSIPATKINTILDLKNKAFLINKNYKITYNQLKWLYNNLVALDALNKSWKLLDGKEADFEHKLLETIIKL